MVQNLIIHLQHPLAKETFLANTIPQIPSRNKWMLPRSGFLRSQMVGRYGCHFGRSTEAEHEGLDPGRQPSALPVAAVDGLCKLVNYGLPVFFVNKRPVQVAENSCPLPDVLAGIPIVKLSELADVVAALGLSVPKVYPANNRIRILQVDGDTPVYFLVNEGTDTFYRTLTLPTEGDCYLYDPWFNVRMAANAVAGAGSTEVNLPLEPLKSIAVVFGTCDEPNFGNAVSVSLPDNIAEEQPEFSGYARYETSIQISESRSAVLEITDVAEGVEVFVNGRSLGIQVVPPFR